MPEGDTIFRSAATLRVVLAGRPLLRFDAPRLVGARPQPGQLVAGVEARGKHLLVHFGACGVGNVFKSEVLFACRVDPFTPVATLDDGARHHLVVTASRQLHANRGGYPRTTVPGGLAVYQRTGRPCRTCATPIRCAKQGEQARPTYWCPTCQAQTHRRP